jgi:hypothetical protein
MYDFETPWQVLGIEPGASVDAIRRAYARKLKQVRPDEDAAGFQRLREARDLALRQQRFYAAAAVSLPQAEADEPATTAAAVTDEPPAAAPPAATPPLREPEPPARQPAPVPVIADDLPPRLAAPASDPPRIEEPAAEAETEPEPARPVPLLVAEPPAGPAPPAAGWDDGSGDAPDSDALARDIERQLSTAAIRWDFDAWRALLAALSRLDLSERRWFEQHILQWLPLAIDADTSRLMRPEAIAGRAKVLGLLDAEFGWLQHDRRLYEVLSAAAADRLVGLLRRSLADRSHRSEPGEARKRVPYLDEADLLAYFDAKEERRTVDYYRRSYVAGRWRLSWHWPAFLFTWLWALWRGLWRDAGWMLAATAGGYYLLTGGPLLTLLGAAVLAAIHFAAGQLARVRMVEQASAAVAQADARNLFDPAQRRQRLGRGRRIRGRAWIVLFIVVFGAGFVGRIVDQLGRETTRTPPVELHLPSFPPPTAPSVYEDVMQRKCPTGDSICRLDALMDELRRAGKTGSPPPAAEGPTTNAADGRTPSAIAPAEPDTPPSPR